MVRRCCGILLSLSTLVPCLAAQQAAEVVLLLSAPRALEAGPLQRAAKAAFGVEFVVGTAPAAQPQLAIDGARATLRWGGHAVDLHTIASPRALDEKAMVGLGDDEQAAVRAHRAQWCLCIEAVGGTVEARQQAYRRLGRLTAELLAADVVALGCVDHGSFVRPRERTAAALREEGALAALEAKVDRSVVALLKAPRRWREADLRAAAERAFAVKLPSAAGPDATDFVVAQRDLAFVKIGARSVILTMSRERWAVDTSRLELRLKQAIDDHRAVLHMVTFGPPGEAEDRACYAHLGKLLAALWDEDCLALNWRTSPQVVCDTDALPSWLRADDPVAATLAAHHPPVLAQFDAESMAKAIATARERFPEAQRWFAGGGELHVKFAFATREGHGAVEHMWIGVRELRDGVVRGVLENEPVDVEGLQVGSVVERPIAELSDWLYLKDGERHGGFSIAVLEAGAAASPVQLATSDDVLRHVRTLASSCAVEWMLPEQRLVRFATLGPLSDELRARQANTLAANVLLQTERIEHGRGAPSGHVAERALLLRQLTALAAGDYWVVERSVADWAALVLPQFADPRTLAWQQYELPNAHGQPRTLVFPLDQRPAALAAATAGELAAFGLALDALPYADRAALLGEAVTTLTLPFVVGEPGLVTRIGTLPKGCRLTAELRLELPR